MSHLSKATWGPACWTIIHAAASSCDAEDTSGFSAFLQSLTLVLPCPDCREHLRTYLSNHPPDVITDAATASRFCFDMHNYVNRVTGKPTLHPRIMRDRYNVHLSAPTVPGASAPPAKSARVAASFTARRMPHPRYRTR